MAIEIRDSDDNVLTTLSVLTRPLYPFEKKSVDTETSDETVNPSFDAAAEEEQKLNNLNLRTIRDKALDRTDRWMFEDSQSSGNVVYTTAEKDTIITFRQALRDWPDVLKTNGFTAIATPTVPSFVPTLDKTRIESTLGAAQL